MEQEDVSLQQRWRRAIMPVQRSRGGSVMLYMQQYHDQLMDDMGHSPRRKVGACSRGTTSDEGFPLPMSWTP